MKHGTGTITWCDENNIHDWPSPISWLPCDLLSIGMSVI